MKTKSIKPWILVLVAVALLCAAYVNRDRIATSLGDQSAQVSPIAAASLELKEAPQNRGIAVCLDTSGSTDSSFAKSLKISLVNGIDGYVPKKPAVTKGGVEPITGLELDVRLVSSRPLAYGEAFYRVSISGVDGLPPRPDMAADGALDPGGSYATWKSLEGKWSQLYDAALTDLAAAESTLRKIDLSQPSASGVHDCLGALASTAPNLKDVTYVVASDLEDNTDGESKVSFRGHPLVVIHACPSGNAGECRSVLNRFSAWAKARKSGDLTVVRPEVSGGVIRKLVEGD